MSRLPRRSRIREIAMKRLLLGFVLVLLLLAAAGVFLLTRLDTGFVASTIADAVKTATGAPVVFRDPPRLSLYPLGVDFGRLAWKQEQPDKAIDVSTAGGHARVALSPLLSGRIVVEEIVLTEPALAIALRTPAETPPATTEMPDAQPSDAEDAADAAVPSDVPPLEVGQVRVEKAHIILTDAAGNRFTLTDLHLNLQNLRRHADILLDTGFSYAISRGEQDYAGRLSLSATVQYTAPNLSIRNLQLGLTPQAVPLPAGLGPLALQGEAVLNFTNRKLQLQTVALSCAASHAELSGEADLSTLNFAGALSLTTAPRTLAALWGIRLPQQGDDRLELSTGIECSPDRLALRQLRATQDKTRLEGSLTLALQPVPDIRGTLHFGNVILDRYLPDTAAATTKDSPKGGPDGRGTALPTERVTASPAPPPVWPALRLSLTADSLRYRDMGVQGLTVRLQGDKGRYLLQDFRCRLQSGGDLSGTGSADLLQKQYGLHLVAESVDLGGLTSMLGKGRPVDGNARLTADLTTRGDTPDAMLEALDGKGTLDAHDLHLQALSALPHDIPGVSGAIPNRINRVQIPFVIRKGEVTSKPVVASADTLNANGQATASLPRKYLHATADVRTLGLTIPVIVDGPFDRLTYTVDPRFLERMATGLPGTLLEGGAQMGKAAGDTARGTGSAIDRTVRGAGGLMRGILGR